MSESKQTRELCRKLEALGALTYPLVGSRYAPPGWPDRYVCHRVWSGFLEFKSHNGVLDLAQIRIMRGLIGRGDMAFVVRFTNGSSDMLIQNIDGEILAESHTTEELLDDLAELTAIIREYKR